MSYMTIKCPWCGTEYTFGVVGAIQVGSGHVCKAVKRCEASGCDRRGTLLVTTADKEASFVCHEHIAGRVLAGAQPGVHEAPSRGRA